MDFNCHHPLLDSKGTSNTCGKKYAIGSSPPTSFLSMNSITLPFSVAPLAVASLLTSLLLLPLLLSVAPGRCSRTWALIISNSTHCLSIFALPLQRKPLFFDFQKLIGMSLPFTLTSLYSRRRILLSFSFLCCCCLYFSGIECSQIFYSFRPR